MIFNLRCMGLVSFGSLWLFAAMALANPAVESSSTSTEDAFSDAESESIWRSPPRRHRHRSAGGESGDRGRRHPRGSRQGHRPADHRMRQYGERGRHDGSGRPHPQRNRRVFMMQLTDGIELTPLQKQQMGELMQGARRDIHAWRQQNQDQIAELRQQLRLTRRDSDQQDRQIVANELRELLETIPQPTDSLDDVADVVLTDEQRPIFEENRRELRQKMDKRRQKMQQRRQEYRSRGEHESRHGGQGGGRHKPPCKQSEQSENSEL